MIINFASGINDTAFGKIQAPLKQYLTEQDLTALENSRYGDFFPETDSTNFGEAYGGQTSLGRMQPTREGAAYPVTSMQDDYTKIIENTYVWRNSYGVTLTAVEDNKFMNIKDGAQSLVTDYYDTKEEYLADFMTNANATTHTFQGQTFSIVGGDSKALFATDHPSKVATADGGVGPQSNLYNVEFSYSNLTKMESIFNNIRSTKGRRLRFQADTIIVPDSTTADAVQKQLIFEAMNADGNPTTANRAGNYHFGRWKVVVWPFLGKPAGLTTGKSWWMLADSQYIMKHKPFVLQNRISMNILSWVDQNNDVNYWKQRSRFSASPTNEWRGIMACIPGVGTTIT